MKRRMRGILLSLNELSESRPGDVKHRWCSRNYKENRCNHGMGHDPSLRKGGSVGNGPHPAMRIWNASRETRSVKNQSSKGTDWNTRELKQRREKKDQEYLQSWYGPRSFIKKGGKCWKRTPSSDVDLRQMWKKSQCGQISARRFGRKKRTN